MAVADLQGGLVGSHHRCHLQEGTLGPQVRGEEGRLVVCQENALQECDCPGVYIGLRSLSWEIAIG